MKILTIVFVYNIFCITAMLATEHKHLHIEKKVIVLFVK